MVVLCNIRLDRDLIQAGLGMPGTGKYLIMLKKVMIMAGGTGGHVFPALAVAEQLRAQGVSVVWLGTAERIEARLVPQAGIPLHTLSIRGLRGSGLRTRCLAPFLLLRALWQAWRIIRQQHPDVVLGMGGYASGPGGVAAWLARIPLVIHEQNTLAGLTNRVLARLASQICCAFPGPFAGRFQAQVVGNPIRPALLQIDPPAQRWARRYADANLHPPLRLLVLGGSLGAAALNTVVPAALVRLPVERRPTVVHQTGVGQVADVEAAYAAQQCTATVQAFIEDMAAVYAAADLVICRAGAMTISELMAVGVASLLIPYPHAVDDHQTANAVPLVQAGGALLLPQSELNPTRLAEQLQAWDSPASRQVLLAMAENARQQATPQAIQTVIATLVEVALP